MWRLAPRLALRAAGLQVAGCCAAHAYASSAPSAEAVYEAMNSMFAGLPDVHVIPEAEEDVIDDSGGHEGYGELTVQGTTTLLRAVGLDVRDTFYDLGSGAGRVVVQLALERPGVRAVGVELAPTRHDVACTALSRLEQPHRCEARLGDLLAARCDDATVVFVAGLLFDDSFMRRLAAKLADLPKLRAIATLRRFPPDAQARLAGAGFEERAAKPWLACTWGDAQVHVYERHGR